MTKSFGIHNTPDVRQLIDLSPSEQDKAGVSRQFRSRLALREPTIFKQDVQKATRSEMLDGGY